MPCSRIVGGSGFKRPACLLEYRT